MKYLAAYAGPGALKRIREQGLSPEAVDVIVGAAGGPKWLVLYGLDQAIFFSWRASVQSPLHLVGSSIGSWRFAALASGRSAYENLQYRYVHQRFTVRPTAEMVTGEGDKILKTFLDAGGIGRILAHPSFRMNILTVRCRWPFSRENRYPLLGALSVVFVLNALSRRMLSLFFTRTVFHDPRSEPPISSDGMFPPVSVPLEKRNFREAVIASGAIPVIMQGVRDIAGAAPGMYRDAGIIDYHVDVPLKTGGIILYPHFMERLIPGWFDKGLPWRKPDPDHLEHVLLLCPTNEFIKLLPYGRIPTRDDFRFFWQRDAERIICWEQVVEHSRILGEEFLEAVARTDFHTHLRPMSMLM